jgi:hypothetical protein
VILAVKAEEYRFHLRAIADRAEKSLDKVWLDH